MGNKTITVEQVAEALQSFYSMEWDDHNTRPGVYYYLHLDENGTPFDGCGCPETAAQSFCSFAYTFEEIESQEWSLENLWEHETLGCETFRSVCKDLAEQVNSWLQKNEI